jgi:hypothetical protein
MSIEKDLIGIQRFNGSEFHIWKWQLKNLLRAKGLLGHIDGGAIYDSDDEQDVQQWREKDYIAHHLLTSAVERPFLSALVGCTTAKEVWDRLLEDHEYKNSEDLHELQRQFFDA